MLSPPSGAALRNREPIAEILARVLPPRGTVLEIASGSGVHVVHFAERMPELTFQPTETSAEALAEIDERARGRRAGFVLPAIPLDVLAPWPLSRADAVVCINMIHASPPETLPALMRGAGTVLPAGAPLVTYGPYRIDGVLSESNVEFDAWLKRERHPSWGVRDLEDVVREAAANGLVLAERIAMPANNFTLVFRRS
jgi:cyclopropane fatty-acyl-phospholipid synthase-like methyltransferase